MALDEKLRVVGRMGVGNDSDGLGGIGEGFG